MITARSRVIGALGLVLSTQLLHGQSIPHYREFQLGGDLASVSALSGVGAVGCRRVGSESHAPAARNSAGPSVEAAIF